MRHHVKMSALAVPQLPSLATGADSSGAWLRYALGTSRSVAQNPIRRPLCGRESRPKAPSLRLSTPSRYIAKLLQVKKVGKQTNIIEVVCQRESLNHGDAFILDAGASIYVWKGDSCSPFEAQMANMAAEALEATRNGMPAKTAEIDDAFWEALGGEVDIAACARARG